ncbi:MAG: cysteine desulfurase family protein [Candidatus Saccharimonadales bacterium]
MKTRKVYLDYAAATPLDDSVLKVMQPYYSLQFYNPSANYLAARDVKAAINQARSQVAATIGAKASEIIFCGGGTEANNLAVHGVMNNYPNSNMVISAIEHPSVYEPAKRHNFKVCPTDPLGTVDVSNLKSLINDQTVLVSVMYVNNEIGTIQPLKEIYGVIKSIRLDRLKRGKDLPIYFHSDACQAANYLDLHISRLGVDLLTINGGKIYGPKQSAALFIKSGVRLLPLIEGGGQERGLRNGTENVAAIIGFTKALDEAQANRQANSQQLATLQAYFIDELSKLSNVRINGSLSKRVVNNVHATFKGVDNEWLLIKLDEEGIMAAAGSACSAASTEPSSVLRSIGMSDQEAQSSIRFSLGKYTTKEDITYTISTLKRLLA